MNKVLLLPTLNLGHSTFAWFATPSSADVCAACVCVHIRVCVPYSIACACS